MDRRARNIAAAAIWLLLVCAPSFAFAHGRANDAPVQGLPIVSLPHGELAVVARHRSQIASLAEAQVRTDPVFRRLLAYAKLQRFACLWGLVPGSIADEDSPFNECAHAFLSADKALLVHMTSMPDSAHQARTLASDLEREARFELDGGALCGWSGEIFDTAAIIGPHWRDLPGHPASLSTLLATLCLAFGLPLTLVRLGSSPGASAVQRP